MKDKRRKDKKGNSENTFDESELYRPRSIEIETEFVKNLIVDSAAMEKVYGVITLEDLTEEGPKEVYKTMLRLYENQEQWNKTTLKSEMKYPEQYRDMFSDLDEPLSSNVFDNLIKNVKITTARRKIHSFLYSKYNNVWESDPLEVTADALGFFTTLDMKMSQRDTKNLLPSIRSHLELMKMRYNGETIGVTTGFESLDFTLGQGLKKQEVTVVVARTSVGKTAFSLSVALNAARAGMKVLFVTVEMDERGIMDRLLAYQTGTPLSQIIRGKAPKPKIKEGYKQLKKLPLTIHYLPKGLSSEVHNIASKIKYTQGLDLVVVDYLGIIDHGTSDNEVQRLGNIVKNFKTTANILNVAVLTPHQMNRGVDKRSEANKDPMLSDIRGSGQIEEDAAVVMFLLRNTMGKSSFKATVRISKNRYGETGEVPLTFDDSTTQFKE